MKKFIHLFLFLIVAQNVASQNLYLTISGKNETNNRTIDSIGYLQKHLNGKSVAAEVAAFSEKLYNNGYLEHTKESDQKTNDSTFTYRFDLGKKTEIIHIYVNQNSPLKSLSVFDSKKDTLIMHYSEVETFMNNTLGKLEKKGFALSKLQLVNISKQKKHLTAELQLTLEIERRVNDIVIKGYPKFPEGHRHNIKRMYRNKIFNQENLKKLYADFEKFRFIKQTKYPEILFTKDSTTVYVYLEKTKANSFDGFIGFSTDENRKVILNGYVDLTLNNIVNTGETFTLYWKSDGKNQKTFNAGIELPYIFKSPLGLKAQLNIFKQDSTFQNTKTAIDLGYFFTYNTRLYLGYQATESSDIQNLNIASISDFKNSFVTTNFEYRQFKTDDFLFPEKTKINFKIGLGSRNSKQQRNKQTFFALNAYHNIYLNEKNIFTIRSENYFLNSDQYIINELYRFGGINSIRGFNENSLQGNFFTSAQTEYRYVLTPGIYVHSIIDYGYFQDKTSNVKENLLGFGFGFGSLTKNGLFNIIYANGNTKDQPVKLSNSIVHISFKANF